MRRNAKFLMIGMVLIGLGLAVYGAQSGNFTPVVFGLAIATTGGLVGKMQREDDAAGH